MKIQGKLVNGLLVMLTVSLHLFNSINAQFSDAPSKQVRRTLKSKELSKPTPYQNILFKSRAEIPFVKK